MNQTKAFSLFSDQDIYLFKEGNHTQLYKLLGAHPISHKGIKGYYFAVFAPGAKKVEVIGNFNHWQGENHALNVRWDESGIWEGFIPQVHKGELYKYRIYSNHDDKVREKADPFAFFNEVPPRSASITWDLDYSWNDQKWKKQRKKLNSLNSPISIYEVHLGSWRKKATDNSLSYQELAEELVSYLVEMEFTHVEFLPVMEHPYYPSWGYLCTGFFSPSSRYGNPNDFSYLIEKLHENGIGVYLDWVPAHFPNDEHALADFDGTHLYEHPDIKKGFHPDWNSLIFNYERPEIRSFLLSSAYFWCDVYHADGLRVDAVASMIYLDYSREEGEWEPNHLGGNENLAAIDFLKSLNKHLYGDFPDIQMIAEESTAFSGVTSPVHEGGLGFGMKWMMGWMNDTLHYFIRDMIFRKFHHNEISYSMTYVYSENFLLPLSHDEVVHGKQSILHKMPGDEWQKFANLRLLYFYMYCHPGHKLLFMGNEIGQGNEWNPDFGVEWHLLQFPNHQGIKKFVKSLNHLYKSEEPLYFDNFSRFGFDWISFNDNENSVLAFIRKGSKSHLICILNFSGRVLVNYRLGAPDSHPKYQEIFNSDDAEYGGSHILSKEVLLEEIPYHGRSHSFEITLPPLAGIILKPKVN